jgi:hypothetical protein
MPGKSDQEKEKTTTMRHYLTTLSALIKGEDDAMVVHVSISILNKKASPVVDAEWQES